MPKTSVKTFLMLLRKLNGEMDHFATVATRTLARIDDIDETAPYGSSLETELRTTYLDCQRNFHKIMDMKDVLMGGLRRKVMENMSTRSASQLSTKSATMRRSRSSGRGKTQRRHSH